MNPYDLFRPTAPIAAAWLESALAELAAPQTLTQRMFVQRMLLERYRTQFPDVPALEAAETVAKAYGTKFPHPA